VRAKAEALLVRKHPEYFNSVGGSVWRGQIYTASKFGLVLGRSMIYHGVFATGFFQTLYSAPPAWTLMLCTSMEYHVLVILPLLVLSVPFAFVLPIAMTSLLLSASVCVAAAWQAELPKKQQRFWSRPLVALLFFLQPIARGWARYQSRLGLQQTPPAAHAHLQKLQRSDTKGSLEFLYYWGDGQIDRIDWVTGIVLRLDQQGWPSKADSGWSDHDVEIYGSRWTRLQVITATEDYGGGKRLFRCRLRGYWSLLAKLAFWSFTGFQLLVIGLSRSPWLLVGAADHARPSGFWSRRNEINSGSLRNLMTGQTARSDQTRVGAEEGSSFRVKVGARSLAARLAFFSRSGRPQLGIAVVRRWSVGLGSMTMSGRLAALEQIAIGPVTP
jgi:hypothetical protein